MKTIEESIAAAMDAGRDTAIIPFLPYIFQDFWELGTPPEIVIDLIRTHYDNHPSLRVLDLGCGKGAVSVKTAAALRCCCHGIDAIAEFIDAAKEKAAEYGVSELCRFEVGDLRVKIEGLAKYDVIIIGATGPVFGDYRIALSVLAPHLTDGGIVLVEEAYIEDGSAYRHPAYLFRRDLLRQFELAGMELIDETPCDYGQLVDISHEMELISARCGELMVQYPEKSALFMRYIQNQAAENDALKHSLSGSSMVLRRKTGQAGK